MGVIFFIVMDAGQVFRRDKLTGKFSLGWLGALDFRGKSGGRAGTPKRRRPENIWLADLV